MKTAWHIMAVIVLTAVAMALWSEVRFWKAHRSVTAKIPIKRHRLDFKIAVREFERIPRGYGIAWHDPLCRIAYAYPLPFNWIAAAIRSLYIMMLVVPTDRRDQKLATAMQSAWNEGYHSGALAAVDVSYEDGWNAAIKHLMALTATDVVRVEPKAAGGPEPAAP